MQVQGGIVKKMCSGNTCVSYTHRRKERWLNYIEGSESMVIQILLAFQLGNQELLVKKIISPTNLS